MYNRNWLLFSVVIQLLKYQQGNQLTLNYKHFFTYQRKKPNLIYTTYATKKTKRKLGKQFPIKIQK